MKCKYVAVIYDKPTQQNLREWATTNGFDLGYGYSGEPIDPNQYEFHTTVFYTNNPHEQTDPYPGYKLIEKGQSFPTQFHLLGENQDVPVIKVEPTGMLATLRQKYERMGYKEKWDSYIPHISISYARKPVDFSKMQLPTFPLMFDYVKAEDVLE